LASDIEQALEYGFRTLVRSCLTVLASQDMPLFVDNAGDDFRSTEIDTEEEARG
jgi:hypothetical protein